jgi:hypothetical protein
MTVMSLLPEHPLLYPAFVGFVIFGGRFLVFASLAFALANPSRPKPIGRTHIARPADFALAAHMRRELGHATLSVGLAHGNARAAAGARPCQRTGA